MRKDLPLTITWCLMGRPKLIGPLTASEMKKKQQRQEWYQKNKELTKQRALESKARTQQWYKKEKCKYQCSHCGDKTTSKLGFYDLSLMSLQNVGDLHGRKSREEIKEAMKNRTCLCNDCWHREYRHY